MNYITGLRLALSLPLCFLRRREQQGADQRLIQLYNVNTVFTSWISPDVTSLCAETQTHNCKLCQLHSHPPAISGVYSMQKHASPLSTVCYDATQQIKSVCGRGVLFVHDNEASGVRSLCLTPALGLAPCLWRPLSPLL